MGSQDVMNTGRVEAPTIVVTHAHRFAVGEPLIDERFEFDQAIEPRFRPEHPGHLSHLPQAGKTVRECLGLCLTYEIEERLGNEFTDREADFLAGHYLQGAPLALMLDIHTSRCQRLNDFLNSGVVDDVITTLSSGKPVNDEPDRHSQRFAPAFVDRTDVIALLQFGKLLFEFGFQDSRP
jgi:hypothetical protein